MADLTVKDINDQPVGVPSYYFGVNSFGKAIRAIPVVPPVSSVIGLTGSISQSQLRTALGMGNAAYVGLGTTGSDAAYGNHTHTPASIGAEAAYGAGTTSQYLRGDKSWQTLNKAAVGLSNADNTSDADKPISTATQTALDAKEPTIVSGSTTQWFRGDKQWALLSKSDVGLSNVDNTTDAGKPISTATQTALDAKNKNITWKKDTTTYGSAGSIGSVKFTGAGVTLSEATGELTVAFTGGTFDGDYNSLSNKPILGTSAALNVPASGNAASGEVVKGSDTRLNDARSPTDHTQAASTISDSTAVGRAVLTATDAAAARAVMGVERGSGLKNVIVNGCRRISLRGNGVAALGVNRLGADGVVTFIGGWSSITGTQILQESGPNDPRFTSGALHYVALGTMTGASGYVIFKDYVEAADSALLGGKSVSVSCKLTAWGTAPTNYYYRVYKANAKNDFTGTTLVTQSPSYGAMTPTATAEQAHTFTLAASDSVNGLRVECVAEYTGAVGAGSYLFQGDVQCRASSQLEPFELRPIALEYLLRQRYLRQQSVWVSSSSTTKTNYPIGMFKTPTISGGGAGFNSTGTDKDTLVCYQTTAAQQTLILDAELA